YSDRPDLRSLPISLDNPKGTIEGCLAACSAVNATLCGLEWYGECFASTSGFQHLAAPIDASQCSTPCRSNSAQICGGNNALSVFKPYTPPPQTVFDKYKYASCDNWIPGPILSYSSNLESCLAACDARNLPLCTFGTGLCIAQNGPSRFVTYVPETSCYEFMRYERVAATAVQRRALVRLGKRETVTSIDLKTGKITSVEV
ncbi:hypothetical protein JCM6882_003821, partial [Rhodosporidiobolus microsporus]